MGWGFLSHCQYAIDSAVPQNSDSHTLIQTVSLYPAAYALSQRLLQCMHNDYKSGSECSWIFGSVSGF